MDSQSRGSHGAMQGGITHYSLDLRRENGQCLYAWQSHPSAVTGGRPARIIDLRGACLPGREIERLLLCVETPPEQLHAVAFVNCNLHNLQELKRKLKAQNIRLFSNTAFFDDVKEAEQWLSAQSLND